MEGGRADGREGGWVLSCACLFWASVRILDTCICNISVRNRQQVASFQFADGKILPAMRAYARMCACVPPLSHRDFPARIWIPVLP